MRDLLGKISEGCDWQEVSKRLEMRCATRGGCQRK